MDGRGVTLTPGTTLRFAPLASSAPGQWSPLPAVPSAGRLTPMSLRGLRRARPSFEASRTTSSSACCGQTRHKRVLGLPPTTSPTLPSRPVETNRWAGGEFMERYTAIYPCGQPGLPDDPVTAYVSGLCMASAAPGSTTTLRARTARRHDPTWECNVSVATASSSSESEPAPHHHGANDQRHARLDELTEARHQLD
jgi:hypothetical protein